MRWITRWHLLAVALTAVRRGDAIHVAGPEPALRGNNAPGSQGYWFRSPIPKASKGWTRQLVAFGFQRVYHFSAKGALRDVRRATRISVVAAVIAAGGCVKGFQGSNLELDLLPGAPVQARVLGAMMTGELKPLSH